MDTKIALENLAIVAEALTALNVRYFLSDGTLLGLVRDGHFLDWVEDEDIDIGVLAEDFNILSFGRYASLMRQKGFTYRLFGVWGKSLITHWWRKNVKIDIAFYFRRGDDRILSMHTVHDIIELSYPAWLIETLTPADFYGKTFMIPKYKEAFLSHEYGDWKIPRRDWDWRTSPLNITLRRKKVKWDVFQLRLSHRILGLSAKVMARLSFR
jgi:phosphorylcholine metabolism protein LicD